MTFSKGRMVATTHVSAAVEKLEAALARIPNSGRPETSARVRAEVVLSHLATVRAAVLVANDHGRYVHANDEAARLTGYTHDELTKLSVWDLTPFPNQTEGRAMWREFVAVGRLSGDYALRRRDGRIVHASFAA